VMTHAQHTQGGQHCDPQGFLTAVEATCSGRFNPVCKDPCASSFFLDLDLPRSEVACVFAAAEHSVMLPSACPLVYLYHRNKDLV
jgi:hypothetical protein